MTEQEARKLIFSLESPYIEQLAKWINHCCDCGKLIVGVKRKRCIECAARHRYQVGLAMRSSVSYPHDQYISRRKWTK